MRFQTLPEWLNWQETLHFTEVDPGLERIGYVWRKMASSPKLPFTVVTVAGTNGKGSSVAMLESILRNAGYKTGTYTSPHILKYNERICIDNTPIDDDSICQAFQRIDSARAEVSLTYFEFATLAAVDIFCRQNIDIALLEVGMGGRLDAVNLFDADIALITPISLDHINWLGTTREQIGCEKAGIITAKKPVVCSEDPPQSVMTQALSLGSELFQQGQDFFVKKNLNDWQWSNKQSKLINLPFPALEGDYQLQNAAAVIEVISILVENDFSISQQNIKDGLTSVKLAGRFQRIPGDVELILDVTHNQQGAINLEKLLTEISTTGRTFAVIGMLKDKDAAAIAEILKYKIDTWYVAGLNGERGMSSTILADQLKPYIEQQKIKQFDMVCLAYQHAMQIAERGDRILVFGSFHTVEAVLRLLYPNYFNLHVSELSTDARSRHNAPGND